MTRNLTRNATRLGLRLLPLIVLALIAAWSGSGCRDKENPVDPGDTNTVPDVYRLDLTAPQVMYRGPSGHVENDTISVRLYNNSGGLVAGVAIHPRAAVSPGAVGPVVQTVLDIDRRPWGSDAPILYWGTGGVDGHETITAYAVRGRDTLDVATVGFKIVNGGRPE